MKGGYIPAKCYTLLFYISLSWACTAQHHYVITYRDKAASAYDISHPEQFLSPASITRRVQQGIPITSDDIPVSAAYSHAIAQLGATTLYTLKWSNQLLCTSPDVNFAQRAVSLPFVAHIEAIGDGVAGSQPHKFLVNPTQTSRAAYDSSYYAAAAVQNLMIHIEPLHRAGYTGRGIIVAVMDVGFVNAPSHYLLQSTYDSNRVLYTWNYVANKADVYATGVHGLETMTCIGANLPGQMVGTAPDASFLLFHTEDENSETILEEYNWAHAAEKADSLGASVLSTSLGYTTFDTSDAIHSHTYAQLDGHTTPIARACNAAASKGILVVNSAGNEGAGSWYHISTPADADSGFTIGAVDKSKVIGNFSGWGPSASGRIKPDVCARGVLAAVGNPNGTQITSNNGTSFSCPIMAGAIACLRQAYPTASNLAIMQAIRYSADHASYPDAHYGYGVPDMTVALDKLTQISLLDTIRRNYLFFPNPFTSSFTLYHRAAYSEAVTIELFDLLGQRVYYWYEPDHLVNSQLITRPDVSTLAAGVYLLRVNNQYLGGVSKQ
jgi:serine protease AprX